MKFVLTPPLLLRRTTSHKGAARKISRNYSVLMNGSKSDKRRMKMKKIIPFPVWRIEELEKKLEEYEEKGYRVKKTRCLFLFDFEKTTPKRTDCFIPYSVSKNFDGHKNMIRGSKADSRFCNFTVIRTGEDKEKLSFIRSARMDYVKSVIRTRMFFALGLLLLLVFALFMDMNHMTEVKLNFYIAFISVSFIFLCYYFYGFIIQTKKCNRKLKEIKEKSPKE